MAAGEDPWGPFEFNDGFGDTNEKRTAFATETATAMSVGFDPVTLAAPTDTSTANAASLLGRLKRRE